MGNKSIAVFSLLDFAQYGSRQFCEIFKATVNKKGFDAVFASVCGFTAGNESVFSFSEAVAESPAAIILDGSALFRLFFNEDASPLSECVKAVNDAVKRGIPVFAHWLTLPEEVPHSLCFPLCTLLNMCEGITVCDIDSREKIKSAYEVCGLEQPEIYTGINLAYSADEITMENAKISELPKPGFVLFHIDEKKYGYCGDALRAMGHYLVNEECDAVFVSTGEASNEADLAPFITAKQHKKHFVTALDGDFTVNDINYLMRVCRAYVGTDSAGVAAAVSLGKYAAYLEDFTPAPFKKGDATVCATCAELFDFVRIVAGSLAEKHSMPEANENARGLIEQVCDFVLSGTKPTHNAAEEVLLPEDIASDIIRLVNAHQREALRFYRGNAEKYSVEYVCLTQKYNKKENECDRFRLGYENVTGSQFWKMTTPLRKSEDIMKKLILAIPGMKKIIKGVKLLFRVGPVQTFNYLIRRRDYGRLDLAYDITKARRAQEESAVFEKMPKISVIVPLYNTPEKFLGEMIKSVQEQTYKNWELCLADGSDAAHDSVGEYVKSVMESDSRIIYKKLEKNGGISENTNEALKMATGDYISLFDHDDLIHPSALYKVVCAVNEKDADFVYTDEATFAGDDPNKVQFANFKSDFAIDTLRSLNYICHLTTFSRGLLDKVGLFRKECDGSQDYDMILRLTEQAKSIVHIPEVLYYWRCHKDSTAEDISNKPYIIEAAHKALSDHLERVGIKGRVKDSSLASTYRIQYDIIGEPLVSIVIANMDHAETLKQCIDSVIKLSTYKNYEIIIVENNSKKPETFEYYDELTGAHDNIRIVTWKGIFNYSGINNFGVKYAKGEYLILLNNDIEIITENWIEEMLMFAQRNDVGAVGAMLYYPDNTIQHAGVIVGLGGVAGHSHKNFPRNSFGYLGRASISQNLSAVTAACVMLPKKVYDEVGGLDEKFQVAFNDVDLCMRIRKAGYLIVFTPYAEMYHYESKSRGSEDTPEKQARFAGEVNRFKERWAKELEAGDPYYNPNLTLNHEDFRYRQWD